MHSSLGRLTAFYMHDPPHDQQASSRRLTHASHELQTSVKVCPPESTNLKRWPLSFVRVATVMSASRASCAAEVAILKATESPSSAHCSTAGASEAILDHPASAYAHLRCTRSLVPYLTTQ